MRYVLVLIVIWVIGCTGHKNGSSMLDRTLFVYGLDSTRFEKMEFKEQIPYQLKVTETDSSKVYQYTEKLDTTRQSFFMFRKKDRNLIWSSWEFKVVAAERFEVNGKTMKFDLYRKVVPRMNGIGPFYFNETFGLLNLNTYSKMFIYLENENQEDADRLLKSLSRGV